MPAASLWVLLKELLRLGRGSPECQYMPGVFGRLLAIPAVGPRTPADRASVNVAAVVLWFSQQQSAQCLGGWEVLLLGECSTL